MRTILVVDDRPDSRYATARPLAAAGFDVRETATGRDALRLARLQVDVIVLDLVLPDMDGYDVLRRLKADPATSQIPVIVNGAPGGVRNLLLRPLHYCACSCVTWAWG
jgi:CheY-like chemotaxis protein